jgi:hypothetical protein
LKTSIRVVKSTQSSQENDLELPSNLVEVPAKSADSVTPWKGKDSKHIIKWKNARKRVQSKFAVT